MRRISALFIASALALAGLVALTPSAQATVTGSVTNNNDGTATVTYSGSGLPTIYVCAVADVPSAIWCNNSASYTYVMANPSSSPVTISSSTSLNYPNMMGGATTLPAGSYYVVLYDGSLIASASNVYIGTPVSGSIVSNSDGTVTVTYANATMPTLYICAVGASDNLCASPAATYIVGLMASPRVISVGNPATSGASVTTIAAGTYKFVLVSGGSAVTSLASGTLSTNPTTTPGTPGKPSAVAGVGSATITVVAPTTGSAVVSYTVTSSPDSKSCTVTVPATSCEVTGLTNGTAYTFSSTATNTAGTSDASAASDAVTPNLKPNTPTTPPTYAKTSNIARPGVSVLLRTGVVTPSGVIATPRVRFTEYVQGLRPSGDVAPTGKLGTYTVTKSGKVIANVKSSRPMTIILTLRAPATAEYAAYKSVKIWVLK